jgi:Xaa-Pro aminopeptidase
MTNLERVKQEMGARGFDAMLIQHLPNVRWLTGFTGSNGTVLILGDEQFFFTDGRYTIQAQEQVKGFEVVTLPTGRKVIDEVSERVKAKQPKSVAFEADRVTFAVGSSLQDSLGSIKAEPDGDMINKLRLIKDASEIAKIEEACKLADACMEHAVRMLQPGVREYDILLDIEFFIRRNGAAIGFEPIVVSGARSALPHGRASEKTIEIGDFVTLDLGASLDGYSSDITRTFIIGKASERHEQVYNLVLEAQQEAIRNCVPGANGQQLDEQVRARFGDLVGYYVHSLGHGLGAEVHDGGRLSYTTSTPIEPNQVWTIEPGLYIEGFGGVRIEDDVLVTETGNRVLTSFPKSLTIL